MEISNSQPLPSISRDTHGTGGRGEAPASTPARRTGAQPNAAGQPDNATVTPQLSTITTMLQAQETPQTRSLPKTAANDVHVQERPTNPQFKNGIAAYAAAGATTGIGVAETSQSDGIAITNPSEVGPINIQA